MDSRSVPKHIAENHLIDDRLIVVVALFVVHEHFLRAPDVDI